MVKNLDRHMEGRGQGFKAPRGRDINDVSRARVKLSSTRTRKLESELDLSSKAREFEK